MRAAAQTSEVTLAGMSGYRVVVLDEPRTGEYALLPVGGVGVSWREAHKLRRRLARTGRRVFLTTSSVPSGEPALVVSGLCC